ncbi:hypothetical protein BL250_07940 [Erwinia sp. OLTSP20]|nr:hypothetical protein BL250_07940 [Erwinia sp. OLTSP20]
MAVNLNRLTTGTMNVNAGHKRTSKARIIHQIQPIRGITNKVSCVLLVPQYHNHTNSLMAQLNEMFGQQLSIRAIVTSWQEFTSLPQPDFLISTLQIPKSMVEWVLINPFLTDRDVSALQYKIERVKQKKKRVRLQENLQKISDETLFFHNPAFSNENEAIEFMAQALNRQGYVDDHFIQDVFQREHSYPTTFGSIAVPHSMKMDAIKTGLCVAISEKPFPWGDNMVNMALIFSINKAERAIFYDIFDNIIVLLLEPANLKKALECRSWKELIVTITSSF